MENTNQNMNKLRSEEMSTETENPSYVRETYKTEVNVVSINFMTKKKVFEVNINNKIGYISFPYYVENKDVLDYILENSFGQCFNTIEDAIEDYKDEVIEEEEDSE